MEIPFFKKPTRKKWSVKRIEERYDAAVGDFAALEKGLPAIVDSGILLDLVIEAALRLNDDPSDFIDIGTGAGLYALAFARERPLLNITLVDLSINMLECAYKRVCEKSSGRVRGMHGDICSLEFGENEFDIACAGAALHHLREKAEWESVFSKLYKCLKPGGSLWISDLVSHSIEGVQELMMERYREYLEELEDRRFAGSMLKFIELEDSPRPVSFQLSLLKDVGFSGVDVLHCNTCYAVIGAVK